MYTGRIDSEQYVIEELLLTVGQWKSGKVVVVSWAWELPRSAVVVVAWDLEGGDGG